MVLTAIEKSNLAERLPTETLSITGPKRWWLEAGVPCSLNRYALEDLENYQCPVDKLKEVWLTRVQVHAIVKHVKNMITPQRKYEYILLMVRRSKRKATDIFATDIPITTAIM